MRRNRRRQREKPEWHPKTRYGKMVKKGEITSIDFFIDSNIKIREEQIVDELLPNLDIDLMLVGQSKGKFGGGGRRVFKQTQKKSAEGNKVKFTCFAVVGNRDGYIGIGKGSAGETVPARDKAFRNAKRNIIRIKRGCGSWECGCSNPHSIPFKVRGKCGSVIVELIPAPKGLGLAINDECKKILSYAGIKDIWSKTYGQTRNRINLIRACMDALRKLSEVKTSREQEKLLGVVTGEKKE